MVSNQSQCYSHRGWMMRSHTELLWARVFDAASIQYLHEPERFNTPHGWYLPDFYMPNIGIYVEIKGMEPTEVEKEKAYSVILATGKPLAFIAGKPNADRGGFSSCMAYFNCGNAWVSMPMHDFDQIYRAGMGDLEWQRILHAGVPGNEGETLSASEVMASTLMKGNMRRLYEGIAKKTRDVTAAKLMQNLPPPSVQELAIKQFFSVLDKRFK